MKTLIGSGWSGGYLDQHLGTGQVRICVDAFVPVARLEDVYFQPPRSLRRLWNYLWELGPIRLFRKVVSRLRETGRNEKVVAIGVGRVLAWNGEEAADLGQGARALFIAPTHPPCVDRIALDAGWVRPAPRDLADRFLRDGDVLQHDATDGEDAAAFRAVGGLLPHAEVRLEPGLLDDLFARARKILEALDPASFRALSRGDEGPLERVEQEPSLPAGTKRAVLFGYGHYAKTNILPNLPDSIRCVAVHELDPLQLGRAEGLPFTCDSAPGLREDEDYDVYFLAGYHHTHAPLASAALRAGHWAVSEKPIVTTQQQLDELVAACRDHPGRFFSGFHKRYNRLNRHLSEDLGVHPGDPIHYYCIVYEVPLPPRHWYRWPTSRSRITSNGCHWIDHFMFINGFPEIVASGTHMFPDGDSACWAEAANGANFSLVLTDRGSNRIGLEEYVEMRAGERKVTIRNNGHYRAESHSRVLRRERVNKNQGYTLMYRTIGERIAAGQEGDSLEAIQRSSQLMLDLEDRLTTTAGRAPAAR